MSLEDMRRDAASKVRKAEDVHVTTEEIALCLGDDAEEFLEVRKLVEKIMDDPSQFSGLRAGLAASRLAAVRFKIGTKAQVYKKLSVGNADLRVRKDLLMTMYDALIENINTLKGLARYEREAMN